MMSCLANDKRVWVRRALLSHPASSSFIQPSINRKPYPLYWGWGMDNNKAAMGQDQIGTGRGEEKGINCERMGCGGEDADCSCGWQIELS